MSTPFFPEQGEAGLLWTARENRCATVGTARGKRWGVFHRLHPLFHRLPTGDQSKSGARFIHALRAQ